MSKATRQPSRKQRLARAAATLGAVSVALLLGACAQDNSLNLALDEKPKTSDIATSSAGDGSQSELAKATTYWGEEYSKKPQDPKVALSYARNLRAMGRKAQALAVLQTAYMFAPDDKEFLSEYGRLALEAGQISTAGELLARADNPSKPDWKIISARGTVLAKQGRHKEAIEYFERARELAPGQGSVLNNLAMAYAMDGQAAKGEELLRQAAASGTADPRVQQNLALVMSLQGKSDNAPASAPIVAQPVAAAAAPIVQATPVKAGAWEKPLPIEARAGTTKTKPQPVAAAGKPLDPDDVIRQAMAAEQSKGAQQ